MGSKKPGAAIIGCGNIAGKYAKTIATYDELALIGCMDLDRACARALADLYGMKVYDSIDAMLADDAVDIVVNLTIHQAHYEITKRCLEAGRHVHSEKPLALTTGEARELCDTAKANGVRLASSPFTWMGEAQSTAWKVIRDGRLGDVRLCYADMNHGRIETWHPNPAPFYEVGALFDVGVYPLTILTTFFGPAKRVSAVGEALYPDRVTKDGEPFHITTPDCVIAVLELEHCPMVRLTANFYVKDTAQKGIEFHGTKGSLHLGSALSFNAPVSFTEYGQGFSAVPCLREPFRGTEYGRGVRDLAIAIREERPHRATGEQAAHVVEILDACVESMTTRTSVEITSAFPRPEPMEWAK